MTGRVTLAVTSGPLKGRVFTYESPSTLTFGRAPECGSARLPQDDTSVSRRHFLLKISPPRLELRDLHSRNGTYVNGEKLGGREKGESAEEAALRTTAERPLSSGDVIRAGKTRIQVKTELLCTACGTVLDGGVSPPSEFCASCQRHQKTLPLGAYATCAICGAQEPRIGEGGATICSQCLVSSGALSDELVAQAVSRTEALKIEGYELGGELGRGGMGAVFKARRVRDDTPAAVKFMLPRVAHSPEARDLFLREVRVTRKLAGHQHCVGFYEEGTLGSVVYLVMEFCPGGSVDQLMTRCGGRVPAAQAVSLVLQALDGLAFFHERGLVHRDLKPQNILLTK